MRAFFVLLLLFADIAWTAPCAENDPNCPWAVLYSEEENSSLTRYNPLILDPNVHPPLEPLKAQGISLYAKVDLLEFLKLTNPAALQDKLDSLIEQVIPDILQKGFTGLFITGLTSLQGSAKKSQVAVQCVMLISMHFPKVPLLLYQALSLLPDTSLLIQGIMESAITSSYNAKTNSYFILPKETHLQKVAALKKVHKIYPDLQIFTLDIWDLKDTATLKKIYSLEESYGFRPYVAPYGFTTLAERP
ncbi:MAG: hypothetical protein NTX49_01360 [Chlamydiae bacterium]|nr:hypothetical protein [Chlamydiota bacterium]